MKLLLLFIFIIFGMEDDYKRGVANFPYLTLDFQYYVARIYKTIDLEMERLKN
mgnify:CR=1 FL=1